jgi:pyridoxal phosphate enzyme (YggS family)
VSIKENLEKIYRRVERAAGRNPQTVKLVAVIKNVPDQLIFEALEAGVTDIGESRIQEAQARFEAIRARFPQVKIHLIGHLQRNKVRPALDMFDIIQSLDSERLAREIAARASKPVPVLIEVNTSGEAAKFGIEPGRTIDLVSAAARIEKIKIAGLMTVGPLTDDREKIRQSFRKVKQLSEAISQLRLPGVEMRFLSMGMSADFEIALEEGSNMIRPGRAIFERGE